VPSPSPAKATGSTRISVKVSLPKGWRGWSGSDIGDQPGDRTARARVGAEIGDAHMIGRLAQAPGEFGGQAEHVAPVDP